MELFDAIFMFLVKAIIYTSWWGGIVSLVFFVTLRPIIALFFPNLNRFLNTLWRDFMSH